MSEWQGHKLSSSGQLRNSDSLPPLNRPYPGQAVWLLPHGGCHVEDHHIDLKAIAPKMHWKWCGNRGWCMSQMANYFVNIHRNWILWEKTWTSGYFSSSSFFAASNFTFKESQTKAVALFLISSEHPILKQQQVAGVFLRMDVALWTWCYKWDGWEWMVSGRGEVKSTIQRL